MIHCAALTNDDISGDYGLATKNTTDDYISGSPPSVTATSYANPANGRPTTATTGSQSSARARATGHAASG